MSNFPSNEPVLVTCGLPYANGKCHIGHLRTYIPADIFVRASGNRAKRCVRMRFDAHGTPIVVNAEELKITPTELVNKYHDHFENIFKRMEIDFSFFGNTILQPTMRERTVLLEPSLRTVMYTPKS